MSRTGLSALLITAVAGGVLIAAEATKVNLEKVKCPVSGKAVKADATADYKNAKVYFCCQNCPKAFAKDAKKFATKANMQLVQTKQAKQVACPISGKDVKDAVAKVAGLEIGLCCNNCKGKVDKAEGDDKLALVFAEKPFEKGFKVPKKEDTK
jgi:YHS domain-containing protein